MELRKSKIGSRLNGQFSIGSNHPRSSCISFEPWTLRTDLPRYSPYLLRFPLLPVETGLSSMHTAVITGIAGTLEAPKPLITGSNYLKGVRLGPGRLLGHGITNNTRFRPD